MKTFIGSLVVVAGLMGALAYAQANVTGNWKGKLLIDKTTIPKSKDPGVQKMIEQQMAKVSQIKFALNLKADKTFLMKVSNLPTGPNQPKAKDQVAEGKWVQKGNTLTLTTTKENGKPPSSQTAKPQNMKVVDGGKKLELTMPGMGSGKLVFTR